MPFMSEEDHEILVEQFNATDDETKLGFCLHQLFEDTAIRHWNKTALIHANIELSFGDLNARANKFARVLVERGVERGDVVGVAMQRSLNLVVVLIAVLKSGAAYVPIDPAFPMARVYQMMEDAAPKLVVASGSTLDVFGKCKGMRLNFDEADPHPRTDIEDGDLKADVQANDLAYIMYTSGSTGQPKGVEITHGAVSNFILSMRREPGCVSTDRLLAISTISFDMAVYELFTPLLCGATTVIASTHEAKDPGALVDLIKHHGITMMLGTPTTWQMLLDSGWRGTPRLDKIMCGGEGLSRKLAERLLDCGDMVFNKYGPTEGTACASVWKVRRDEDVLIGNPIANAQLYVLDEDLKPLPLGCSGELYIGGAGVAVGYRNKPELTRLRFLHNPFHAGRLYRTGDLARFTGPQKLSVLGRADSQVKIRGYRIELQDIEAAINNHEEISGVVVVSYDERLVAYYMRQFHQRSDNDTQTCGGMANMDETSLGQRLPTWLAERLPSYMIPAFFVELDAFPLTLNGKIDRNSLPNPVVQAQVVKKPSTDIERSILSLWSEILGHDHIGVDDNFFKVGGDSVRLVRLQVKLEKVLDRPVSLAKLFEHYTVRTQAVFLAGTKQTSLASLRLGCRQLEEDQDIAVISMACRLPGAVTTPEEFWDLLANGKDVTTSVPKDRWDAEAIYDADPDAPGKSYCRRGGFLSSIDSFDASFFGMSPREAQQVDPAQHIVLETCWEGFERAGYTTKQLRGSQTGVFIGISNATAHHDCAREGSLRDLDGYTGPGSAGSTLSGRVSYTLGLEGPTMTIDTACSSSLVTTHLACAALLRGECDMAVSGGISLMLTPALHVEFSRLRGISPDGRCRAFAADSQGVGFSEGAVVVVLKRLSCAQRDGDRIHAILRGSAVNHGGRSAGLTTPSGPAQQRLIRTALANAGLKPSDIDYVEAHGTGTKLGDPIEGVALAEVFGDSRLSMIEPLWVGSVKSNIGHSQAAAGLVGLLKVILALQHDTLPQTLHVTQPTPAVDWQSANMSLVQEKLPWLARSPRRRRAGVSAFGLGGTNAHVIVEESPERIDVRSNFVASPPAFPLMLSAHKKVALREQVQKLLLQVRSTTDNLGDLAYSLATTRNHFQHRLVILAKDNVDLTDKLAAASTRDEMCSSHSQAEAPRLSMLFTGQGSQFPGMGKDLARYYPVFRDALNEIVVHFAGVLEKPLLEVMWSESHSEYATLLQRTDYAQPAIFALQVAVWRLWSSWGVQPDSVLGHSVGELAAAHVAGVMDLSDASRLVAARGCLMQAARRGAMVSLEASETEVTAVIKTLGLVGKVEIAGQNTPIQTVASGDIDAVEHLKRHYTFRGYKSHKLGVSRAFHSYHMDDILPAFLTVAESVRFHPPTLMFVSSVTGKVVKPGELEDPAYWTKQARSPVRFSDGIQTLANEGMNVFLESGASPILCAMGMACLDNDIVNTTAWLPCLDPKKGDAIAIQDSLAILHSRHVPIDWSAYFKPFGCEKVELPTYAFQRTRLRLGTEPTSSNTRPTNPKVDDMANHESLNSPRHLQFVVDWKAVDTDDLLPQGTWGILYPLDGVMWAEDVTAALSGAGIQVIPVKDLKEAEYLDGLLCLWDSAVDVGRQAQDLSVRALEQLQNVAQAQLTGPLVWVTRHAMGVGVDDHPAGLGAAPLWGLMRTARNEHPEMSLRLIDLSGEGETVVFDMLASTLMLGAEPECVLRHKQVLVPRMRRSDPTTNPATQQLVRTDGAVLITGGLGDLGQHVARRLAGAHHVRDLVLTSRRGMEAEGSCAIVAELAKLGAKVTVVAGDVADFDCMKSIMTLFSETRPLRGVVHAAGVAGAGVLSTLIPEHCAPIFAPKIDGAWNLHRLTRDMDLDMFVLFSSIAGVVGMPGLGIYSAANTFLNTLAYVRRTECLPATAVAYGPFESGGMATAFTDATRAHLAQFGLDALTPAQGMDLLEQAVRGGHTLFVAAALNQNRLQCYHEERGGVPPMLSTLLRPSSLQVNRRGWELRRELREANHEQRAKIILCRIQEMVASALGFALPEDVDVKRPLQDIGVDSLTAILTRNQLATLTGLKLSANIVFLHPNLTALSQSILSQLLDDSVDTSVSNSESGGVTPATTVSGILPTLNMTAIRKGCLDSSFSFENVAQKSTRSTRLRSVLVIGATGFIGSSIAYELLERGVTVHCLVRASSVDDARLRLVDTLGGYGLWKPEYEQLLTVVVGDIAQFQLGLTDDVFSHLAQQVDAVCHAGGLVDWMRPLDDYVGPNIISTHEVLRLANRGPCKPVHFISTVATLPRYFGFDVSEEEYEYHYATSKFTAERMVAAARWRGAEASVYRLPFIMASASTGHFRLDRGDFLHNLIVGSIEMGSFPSVDADSSIILPVDYLSKTIVTVMTEEQSRLGQDFDFADACPLKFDDFFKLVCTSDAGQEIIAFYKWRQRALAYAIAHPKSHLARIATIIDGCTDASMAAMFQSLPLGGHVFGGHEYPAPIIDEQSIRRYLSRIHLARAEEAGSW